MNYRKEKQKMIKKYCYQILTLEDLPGEVWKTITYAPLYQVSNMGRVKAVTYEKWHSESKRLKFYPEHIMKQGINNKGYLVVSLINDEGKHKTYRVNRLVLEAFSENPDNLPDACHINEDKKDNRLIALKWGTHAENVNASLYKQRMSKSMGMHIKCDSHEFTSITKAANFYRINKIKMWKWLTGKEPMPEEWKKRGLQRLEE